MSSTSAEAFITASSVFFPEPPEVPVGGPLAGIMSEIADRTEPRLDEAHKIVGRKGLLYKEPATRMALCVVHRALGLTEGERARPPLPGGDRTAVVVSSNLGNVETVSDIVRHVREDRLQDVSALAGPNASSNVIASTIALRFGFSAPNLMLCSGATGGLDAVRTGVLLLRADRAERVVVVGVEPDDPEAVRLAANGPDPAPLRAGAACVVLSPRGAGARVSGFTRHTARVASGSHRGIAVGKGFADAADERAVGLESTYGASGTIYTALAAQVLGEPGGPDTALVACGDDEDGYHSMTLTRAQEAHETGRAV